MQNQKVHATARRIQGLNMLAGITEEDEMLDQTGEMIVQMQNLAATSPSANWNDVALKLALIVQDLAAHTMDTPGVGKSARFTLASCALADLTVLQDRPIELPRRAGERLIDKDDIKYWRRRAAAQPA